MRLINFGKSVLIASIPGAVLPIVFFLLFSLNTAATRRDVLPSLNDPVEAIGWCGSAIFSIPIFVTIVGLNTVVLTAHEQGYIIPFFDLLTPQAQLSVMTTIGLVCNVLLWAIPVSFLLRKKKMGSLPSASQDDFVINESQS
jgi:hypothetical protein